jgi:bifunctional non-homologous end joining protein LigD
LFVFDILQLDGADITGLPYLKRRALLEDLRLDQAGPRIVTPPVWSDVDGNLVLDVMREAGLEGVVAKAANSPYQAGRRSRYWLKTPLRNATRVVIGGWIPSGSRDKAVGSLLVGGYDDAGALKYCAHITSGFTDRARHALHEALSEIGCAEPPFTNGESESHAPRVRWVRPLLVGRVEYREFTTRLRHAAWKGLEPTDPMTVHLPTPRQ